LLALLALASVTSIAQKNKMGSLECKDNWSGNDNRLQRHCEMREQTLAAGETITVDSGKNGGISVKGSDRNDVLVRARVESAAPSENEAMELAKQVRIETGGSRIHSAGPEQKRDSWWSASFEILVPRRSNLALTARNGGIAISDVNGRIEFNGLNGGVVLRRVGGNVQGSTTNGGLVVELEGSRWDGEELNVKTTNGGVTMSVPENYSARLETGTVNGHVSTDFPVTVQGRISKQLSMDLGSGGPTVRAMTTNGGVRLKRAGSADSEKRW
jgi:hypothetical protein